MSDQPTLVRMPPDPYADVYEQAVCKGLNGDVHPAICAGCPVGDRCGDLYEDLQFGTLQSGGKTSPILTGTWGGRVYEQPEGSYTFMRDGKRWSKVDRPHRKEWSK